VRYNFPQGITNAIPFLGSAVVEKTKRPRKSPLCFRASEALEKCLREQSLELKISRSQLILMAIDQFLAKQAKTPVA